MILKMVGIDHKVYLRVPAKACPVKGVNSGS